MKNLIDQLDEIEALCNLKEVKDSLRISFDNIANVDEAIEMLEMVL